MSAAATVISFCSIFPGAQIVKQGFVVDDAAVEGDGAGFFGEVEVGGFFNKVAVGKGAVVQT